MAKKPTKADTRSFLGNLYETPQEIPQGEYDEAVTRLVVRTIGNVVVGDQALQSVLTHFAMSNSTSAEDAKSMASAVAGIKQRAVNYITEKFPNSSLEDMVRSAKDAGLDVQVLGKL